jgi:hypothetical protein
MNDYKKEVGSKPSDPYERIEIAKIGQKLESEETPLPFEEKKSVFAFLILNWIKKIMNFFSSYSKKKEETSNLRTYSNTLKESFERLGKENLSEDSNFLITLSNSWKNFIDSYEREYLQKQQHNPNVEQIISEVNNYLGGQEFSLGYYLLKYRHGGWHPFPFINILNHLHNEYKESISSKIFQKEIAHSLDEKPKKASSLEKWCSLLDKIN